MGFYQFIANIQKKPKSTRVKILWLIVIVLMIVVFGIWLTTIKDYSQKAKEAGSSTRETVDELKEDLPFWQSNLQEAISDISTSEEELSPIKLPVDENK